MCIRDRYSNSLFFFGNSLISISLQLLLPNGKTGANGPNAVCPVAKDPNCEPELAVERSLEVTTNVLGNLQRLGNARHPSVQVFSSIGVSDNCSHCVGIDGEWQEWGEWSHCDPSCLCARKSRSRACTVPLFGGNHCVGDPTETEPCSESPYQSSCQNTTSPG